jgi:hypothetical protein
MYPCFLRKYKCPYYPYINAYPIDIRIVNTGKEIIEVDPFLYFSVNIQNLSFFEALIDYYDIMINGLFFNKYELMIDTLKNISKNYNFKHHIEKKIKYMKKMTVVKNGIRMHILTDILLKLKYDNKYIHNILLKYIKDKKINITNIIYNRNIKYQLLPLTALSMDVYLLSHLFLSKSTDIIVYTGYMHTISYRDFFKNYLDTNPLLYDDYKKNHRCVKL